MLTGPWPVWAAGSKLGRVEAVLRDFKGGVSGGTIASAMNIQKEAPEELKSLGTDPLYLVGGVGWGWG